MADQTSHIINIFARLHDSVSKNLDKMANSIDATQIKARDFQRENAKLNKVTEASYRRLSKGAKQYEDTLDSLSKKLDLLEKKGAGSRARFRDPVTGRIMRTEDAEAFNRKLIEQRKQREKDNNKHYSNLLAAEQNYITARTKILDKISQVQSGFDPSGTGQRINRAEQTRNLAILRQQLTEINKTVGGIGRWRTALRTLRERIKDTDDQTSHFVNVSRILKREMDDNHRTSIRFSRAMSRLGRTMLGFAVAGVIAFLQAFASSLVAVIGHLIALAGSAATAAGVLGGVFTASLAQAIPVVGIFGAALSRLTLVQDALNQQVLASKSNYRDATDTIDEQRDAVEQITEAQRALNEAREDARREIQDLQLAEQQATLSFRDSQEALRDAIQEGNIGEVEQALLDRKEARLELSRAKQDAAAARRGGVAGMDQVISAANALRDAQQAAADATENTAAAVDNLGFALSRLSPAERRLYDTILRFKARVRKELGGVTDNIINAFTFGINKAEKVLDNARLVQSIRRLSKAMGRELRGIFSFLTTGRNQEFFRGMTEEARKNLKPMAQILKNIWRIFRDISETAAPAFAIILGEISGKFKDLRKSVGNNRTGLLLFFIRGIQHLRAWGKLLLNAVKLLGALFGASNESALKGLDDMNKRIENATKFITENHEEVQDFFNKTQVAFGYLIDIIVALGAELVKVFDPEAVKAFRDILVDFLIPALGQAIIITGFFVKLLDDVLSAIEGTPAEPILKLVLALMLAQRMLGVLMILLGPLGTLLKTTFDIGKYIFQSGAFADFAGFITGKFKGAAGLLKRGLGKIFGPIGRAIGWIFARDMAAATVAGEGAGAAAGGLMGRFRRATPKLRVFFRRWAGRLGIIAAIAFITFGLLDDEMLADLVNVGTTWGEKIVNGLISALNLGIDAINAVLPAEAEIGTVGRVDWTPTTGPEGRARATKETGFAPGSNEDRAIARIISGAGLTGKITPDQLDKLIEKFNESRKAAKAYAEEIGEGKGQKRFNETVKTGSDRLRQFNNETEKVTKKQNQQRDSAKKLGGVVGFLQDSFWGAGGQSRELGKTIGTVTNNILTKFGAKKLNFSLPTMKKIAKAVSTVLPFQQGGWFGDPRERKPDDRMISVAGGEAILTGHHQRAVNMALAFGNAAGVVPYSGLEDMFARDRRKHMTAPIAFQRGGKAGGLGGPRRFPDAMGALPGLDALAWFLKKNFGLGVSSGYRPGAITTTGNPSDHGWGGAIDVSNGVATPQMDAAYAWLTKNMGPAIKQILYRTMVGGNHFNHIHVALLEQYARNAAAVMALAGGGGAVIPGMMGTFKGLDKIKVKGPDGPLKDMLQKQSDKLVGAANKFLDKKLMKSGRAGMSAFDDVPANMAVGNGAKLMKRISQERGWDFAAWWELDRRETSHGTNLSNPTSSARLRGQFLDMNWGKYGPGSDPRQNPTMAQQIVAMARYIAERYGNPTRALAHHDAYNWYGMGGIIPEFGMGGVVPGPIGKRRKIIAHGGETILPTHQTGGFATGALLEDVDALQKVARGILKKSKGLGGSRFQKLADLLNELTREGGALDDISLAIEELTTLLASKLTQWAYKIRNKVAAQIVSNVQLANAELDNLEIVGRELTEELTTVRKSIKLIKAKRKKTKDKTKKDKLTGAINSLQEDAAALLDLISQNVLSQIDAQQAIFDSIMDEFAWQIGQTELMQQIIELQGQISGTTDTAGIIAQLTERGSILQNQRTFLQQQLAQAQAVGDIELVRKLQTALLENQLAILQNTQALNEVNGTVAKAFDFNTTSWLNWREAILDGIGGVLPKYLPVPSAQTGGLVTKTGLINVHAGEVIHKEGAGVRDVNLNITSPTEVVDETALAAQIAWRMKNLKV